MITRANAIQRLSQNANQPANSKVSNESFGCDVFSDRVMRERLPKEVYKAFRKTIISGDKLDNQLAASIGSVLQGSDGLVKTGTATLTGANTYTGTTTVSGGEMVVNGDRLADNTSGTGLADVLVTGEITMLGGTGRIAENIILSSGATISPRQYQYANGRWTANGIRGRPEFVAFDRIRSRNDAQCG
ncbi:MAG TPA: glutamine synthetase III [Pirellulaceae bacterium]|nr:glutamine synthetase III [Pirellulaceae bacterium]HMP71055.1 glutamine synthetase III [Pirellulaceae bacterium]